MLEREGRRLTIEPIGDSEYDQWRNNVSFCLFEPWANLELIQPTTLDLPYRNWPVGTVVHADEPVDEVGISVDDGLT